VTTLALDLGTNCGWCVRVTDGSLHSGTWKLTTIDRERRLWEYLDGTRQAHKPDRVVVEKGIVYPGRPAGAVVGFALHGVLRLFCQFYSLKLSELTPAAVKKCATGKGNAKKALVREAMVARFPDQRIGSDDQADALAVLFTFECDGLPLMAGV
jgi:Holliday junction resolvasome RuvABC endonuclease subunit